MKVTLGTKDLEAIAAEWAINKFAKGTPTVKIVKRQSGVDVEIYYPEKTETEAFNEISVQEEDSIDNI